MPGIWDHGPNWLQVARAASALGNRGTEGRIASAAPQSWSSGGEGSVPDGALEANAFRPKKAVATNENNQQNTTEVYTMS